MNRKKPSTIKFAPVLGRCELGPLRAPLVDRKGKVIPRNCDKPAVKIVAGVSVCQGCSNRLDAIVRDANTEVGHRHPTIEKPWQLLRKSA